MIYGYARVSTQDQNLDLQIDALRKWGCERIVKEKASSGKERPILKELLSYLEFGDTLVVWKLDRLGRSIRELISFITQLQERGLHFHSLQDNINTTTAQGRLFFHLMASFAEYEREMIRERTSAGLSAARARGRKGGRPSGLTDAAYKTALAAHHLYQNKTLSIRDIVCKLKISTATFYKYVKLIDKERGAAELITNAQ